MYAEVEPTASAAAEVHALPTEHPKHSLDFIVSSSYFSSHLLSSEFSETDLPALCSFAAFLLTCPLLRSSFLFYSRVL